MKSFLLTAASTLCALLTIGCITKPPPTANLPLSHIPKTWVANANPSSIKDQWWREFNDPQLNSLVNRAIAHNHDLKAAAARIQTAAAQAQVSSADLFPTLGASFDGSRRKQVTDLSTFGLGATPGGGAAAPSTISSRSDSFGVALNTSWEIDLWGRIRKSASAATADLQAAEAEYAAKALSLAGQTTKAWFALTEARQQLNLAISTRDNYKKTAKQARDRVEVGIQSPTDKHLAESNLASSEALVQQRREAIKRAARQLDVIVGRYPTGNAKGSSTLPSLRKSPPAGLPSTLISRRPDLIAAERRLAASIQRTGAAKASLYPQISLTASGGRSATELNNLTSGNFTVWSIAGNIAQPIFQGGRLRANVAAAKGQQREASELFAQSALTAYSEVETALSVESILARRETNLATSAEAAKKSATVASNRYNQGVETFLVILESQRRTLDAQSALISARRARLDNRVDLYLALGGGFKFR